jgi:hypothetical protein
MGRAWIVFEIHYYHRGLSWNIYIAPAWGKINRYAIRRGLGVSFVIAGWNMAGIMRHDILS